MWVLKGQAPAYTQGILNSPPALPLQVCKVTARVPSYPTPLQLSSSALLVACASQPHPCRSGELPSQLSLSQSSPFLQEPLALQSPLLPGLPSAQV